MTGDYANSDWGVYNAISNGGNTPNLWRTLSGNEWNYVFYMRSTPSNILYAKATVNSVNGVILLPDNWNSTVYALNYTNRSDAPFTTNEITEENWATMESAGAVFLPAAGQRLGDELYDVGYYGLYWSSSLITAIPYGPKYFFFDGESADMHNTETRSLGFSVRLARDVE